jgi:hypothetical protein
MSETLGAVGINTQLKIGSGTSPETFALIKDIFGTIDGPSIDQEYADFTHMQSTSGFKERKATWKSPGQVTFAAHWINADTQHEALVAAAIANPATKTSFQMLYPDLTLFTFEAYPSVKFSADMNGALVINVTLSLEGSYTVV